MNEVYTTRKYRTACTTYSLERMSNRKCSLRFLTCTCIPEYIKYTAYFAQKHSDTILHLHVLYTMKTLLATTDMMVHCPRISGHSSVSKCNSKIHALHQRALKLLSTCSCTLVKLNPSHKYVVRIVATNTLPES